MGLRLACSLYFLYLMLWNNVSQLSLPQAIYRDKIMPTQNTKIIWMYSQYVYVLWLNCTPFTVWYLPLLWFMEMYMYMTMNIKQRKHHFPPRVELNHNTLVSTPLFVCSDDFASRYNEIQTVLKSQLHVSLIIVCHITVR